MGLDQGIDHALENLSNASDPAAFDLLGSEAEPAVAQLAVAGG